MIFRIISITLLSFLITQSVNAQTQQIIPIYTSKALTQNTLEIKSDSGNLNIKAYKANVIKLTFFDKSLKIDSIKISTAPVNVRVTQNIEDVFFATDSLLVIINKYDLSFRFLKKNNEELFLKCDSYFLDNSEKAVLVELQKNENLQMVDLKKFEKDIDLKSKLKKLYKKKNACEPAIFSPKGYALYFKNSTNKKVQLISTDHQLKVNGSFYPKSFYFLSGDVDEIERDLEEL